jgi:hypothetical protein
LRLLRQSGSLNGAGGASATAILTQVDLKKHARYRYGDAGEFLVTNNAMAAPPLDAERKETEASSARNDRSLLALRSKLGSLKARRPSRPKAAGEGADGRAV